MTSKRKKGDGSASSSASQPFDKNRFRSYYASQRYHKLLANKPLIPERGLRPEPQDGEMANMIRKQEWERFTSQPEPAVVNIVREFYANATEADGNKVMVRGKWVNVGRKAINAYYGLSKITDSEYAEYIDEDLDYSEVILELCEPGTDWTPTASHEATNFPSSKLSRYGKAWFGFICAKLMPARHKTEVTKERAALLYCIAMGKSVDVGELIHASIKKFLEGHTSGGLPHPSLITDLCKLKGVQWDADEVLQAPLAVIDHSVIARFKVWAGGVSEPKGLGYIIIPTEPAAAGPSEPEVPPAQFTALVDELRRDSRHHTRRIDLVARRMEKAIQRIDCVAQRQDVIYSSLTQLMAHLPAPPALPQYPPLSPELDATLDDSDG